MSPRDNRTFIYGNTINPAGENPFLSLDFDPDSYDVSP
jgi:hypothetical protein